MHQGFFFFLFPLSPSLNLTFRFRSNADHVLIRTRTRTKTTRTRRYSRNVSSHYISTEVCILSWREAHKDPMAIDTASLAAGRPCLPDIPSSET